ncbi:thiamine diphosphokinase [Kineothrix sp. MB12-C1]|uniref:thiamine diphosphokinase n=1 Tax=Kineothrix sp. MB12-C1 TaxID=3070215 RepID=UPI0027D212F1|nr:thiamine diphosphokinase [Kineothrix sp. MB12-C1]WMC92887.1 thiamine diphosphokinase [Kineothrix sp. MB12-C1]
MGNGRCIIIGAGDFTLSEIEKKKEDLCIAVDGGYLYCKLLAIEPDFLIGDMDSIDESMKEEIEEIKSRNPGKVIELNTEKDDTDALAAIKLGIEKGYETFLIYGAMGGRLEHTIANIQCLSYLKNNGKKGYMMDANVMVTVIKDESVKFAKSMDGYLSLFALGKEAKGVTIKGMKYLLDQITVTNDYPIGISNEFIGEEGEITVEEGMLLLIVTWNEEEQEA